MKSKQLLLLKFAFVLALFLPVFSAKASHVMGSEITYQCTGTPSIYNVTVKLYRDCQGIQLCANCPSSLSPSCSIPLNINGYASPAGSGVPASPCTGVSFGTQTLSVVSSVSGFDVVQLCSSSKTVCTNCGTRTAGTFTPGIEVYTFYGQVNLSSIPASCCLVSIGYNTCCRNNAITTLNNPGGLNFYSEAIINRCATPCNSSPTLAFESEIVVPAGNDFVLNLGAVDPDGDSLSYHQGASLTGSNTIAPYVTPYSPTVPFPYLGAPSQSPPALAPFGISMNVVTGDYRFRPQGLFVAPIVIEIKQWKTIAGVPTLMGITRKEHQFYSQFMPANNAPTIVLYRDSSTQTISTFDYTIFDTICVGQTFCRTLVASDINTADTTDLTWNLPSAISSSGGLVTRSFNLATRAINGPRKDSIKFCWTPPNGVANSRPYYLNVIAKDRRCPLNAKTIQNIGLVVIPSPSAVINKVFIDTTTRKFKYTKTNAVYNNPTLTQWQIETGPKSNVFTSYNTDSVNSHTFTNNGWHKIRLFLAGNCASSIGINDSILVTNFNLTLVEAKNIICKNTTSGRIIVKATGGWPPYQYQIKVGSNLYAFGTNDTFSNLTANTYTINVKDSLSNTTGTNAGSLVVTLTEPLNSISMGVQVKGVTCNGDSNGVITIRALNNVGPFQVKLGAGNFQNDTLFTNLKPDERLFTIRDSIGCMASQIVTFFDPAVLICNVDNISHVKCKGDSSAIITIGTTGGVTPYKMRINGSAYQTNTIFLNQKAGPKLIEVSDANNCIKTISTTINEPSTKLTVSVLSKTPVSCASSFGSATLSATEGTTPYKYGRLGGPAPITSPIVSNLAAGVYTFLVRDSNLCRATVIDTIKSISPLNLLLGKKDITCNGLQNGIITCATTGGLGVYLYKLDAGAYGSSNVFTNVSVGTHTITVKDSALKDTSTCVKTGQITINEPTPLTITITGTNTACVGASTGTAEVFVSGGKMPYTYSWNTSPIQNTAKATKLPAGKVMVTIADSNSCLRKDSVVIGAKTLFNDEAICAVSVDSITNQNLIVWNKTPDKGTAAYQIWVAPNGTAIPTLLTTIPYNSPAAFLDNISTPLPASQAYYYSLKSVDSCANTSTLSFSHRPLKLSNTISGNRVNLSWMPYAGSVSINQYKVYRANNNGAYNIIATLAFGTNTYVDSLGGPGTKHYLVEGVYSPACFANFKVLSNRVSIYASGLQEAKIGSSTYLVYPNPSNGKISIKKQANGQDIKKVEVTSILGSVLFVIENDKPLSEQNLDLSQIAAGTYHLVITNEKGTKQMQQIVLQK